MAHQLDNPVWEEGYNAYCYLLIRDDNPYSIGSQKYKDWNKGYDEAEREHDIV